MSENYFNSDGYVDPDAPRSSNYDSDEDELSEDESEDVSYTSATNARGESVSIPDRSHFPDGSRTWRYAPEAKPSDWPAGYVDENIEQVMTLGWIVPNEQGYHWTEGEAEAANAAYIEQATAAYRVDDSYFDESKETEDEAGEQQEGSEQKMSEESADAPAPTPPPAPTAPTAPTGAPAPAPAPAAAAEAADYGWQRPADPTPGGTGYGDVMDELRRTIPQNDGLWSAERAASAYGDTQFAEESGINAADQRAMDVANAAYGPDGRVSAEGLLGAATAGNDAARARVAAEAAPNRYQQTTDRDNTQYEQARADLDAADASLREQVTSNPSQFGIGLSYDAQEYAARSGQTLEPGTELNAEQIAWLQQVRAADEAESRRQYEEFAASPEGQRQQAESDAANARYEAREERFEQSRARAEERQ